MSTLNVALLGNVVTITFTALAGAGAVSVPGLDVGDILVAGAINGTPVWPAFASFFEPVVSVANQLQQLGGDLIGPTFTVYLLRPAL